MVSSITLRGDASHEYCRSFEPSLDGSGKIPPSNLAPVLHANRSSVASGRGKSSRMHRFKRATAMNAADIFGRRIDVMFVRR